MVKLYHQTTDKLSVTTIKGSIGPFTLWPYNLGAKQRALAGLLLGLDVAAAPFQPNGTVLKNLRSRILLTNAPNSPLYGVEVIKWPRAPRIKVLILDWDETISKFRCGWEFIMTTLIAKIIHGGELNEHLIAGIRGKLLKHPDQSTRALFKDFLQIISDKYPIPPEVITTAYHFVLTTKGERSTDQMTKAIELATDWAGQGHRLGGLKDLKTAQEYHDDYQRMLGGLREKNLILFEQHRVRPADLMVPGAPATIDYYYNLGLPIFVLTGSNRDSVMEEAELFGLIKKINDFTGLEGAAKEEKMLSLAQQHGQPLAIGDGKLEIAGANQPGVDGYSVAVVPNELDPAEARRMRKLLIDSGAGAVVRDLTRIPDFHKLLLAP